MTTILGLSVDILRPTLWYFLLFLSSILLSNRPSTVEYDFLPFKAFERSPSTLVIGFTVPYPFVGHKRVEQENALISWNHAGVSFAHLLYPMNVSDVADAADHYAPYTKATPIAGSRAEWPIYVSDVFRTGQLVGGTLYVNSDIVLIGSLQRVILTLHEAGFRKYLVIGRRYDVRRELVGRLDDPETQLPQIESLVKAGYAEKRGNCYVDYFLFSAELFSGDVVPPFILGRLRWDNWLTEHGLKNAFLIDASDVLMAVHMRHRTTVYHSVIRQSPLIRSEVAHNKHLYPTQKLVCLDRAQYRIRSHGADYEVEPVTHSNGDEM